MSGMGLYFGRSRETANGLHTVTEAIESGPVECVFEKYEAGLIVVRETLNGGIFLGSDTSALVNAFNPVADGRIRGVRPDMVPTLVDNILSCPPPRPHRDSLFVNPRDTPEPSSDDFDDWCCGYLEGMENE